MRLVATPNNMARSPSGQVPAARTTARKLILRNFLAPGDIVMLTAAVRELHHAYPGQFLTDVRTSCPDLWLHNPYLTALCEQDPQVEVIDCEYPLIDHSNSAPFHCIHGFVHFLNERLGLNIQPRTFGGDIHLSPEEKSWVSQVHELGGRRFPFWLIVSGGKFDFTAKWWSADRFQAVVDHFRDRIQFVQVGEIGHHHPRLRGTVDLRGRTDLRELIRLVYHAQGVLCGVTALMHLAAAIETYPTRPRLRPAVIVAGGREPTHWQAYPNHQFIHTIGALPCCETGGCWRSRAKPLGDGAEQDAPANLCVDLAGPLPRCMDMISAADVISRITKYFDGGATRYLKRAELAAAHRAVRASEVPPTFDSTFNIVTAPQAVRAFTRAAVARRRFEGAGIIVCSRPDEVVPLFASQGRGGRATPFTYYTQATPSTTEATSIAALGGSIHIVQPGHSPIVEALMSTPWRHVLLLADGRLDVVERMWAAFGKPHRAAALFAANDDACVRPALWRLCGKAPPGQVAGRAVILDRQRCWRALQLWRRLCDHPYLFVEESGGELGALYFALRMLNLPCELLAKRTEMTGAIPLEFPPPPAPQLPAQT